eukprot:gene383-833_t
MDAKQPEKKQATLFETGFSQKEKTPREQQLANAISAGLSLGADKLPPTFVLEGKTKKVIPDDFPKEFDAQYTENHWCSTETVVKRLQRAIVPYVIKKRKELNLDDEQWAVYIMDLWRPQWAQAVLDILIINYRDAARTAIDRAR